jgi:hypothetical protein
MWILRYYCIDIINLDLPKVEMLLVGQSLYCGFFIQHMDMLQHRLYCVNENMKIVSIFYSHWLACQEMNQLNVVLQLALSPVEEEAFTNFLQYCHNPRADDMRVMYYLERSRSVPAV